MCRYTVPVTAEACDRRFSQRASSFWNGLLVDSKARFVLLAFVAMAFGAAHPGKLSQPFAAWTRRASWEGLPPCISSREVPEVLLQHRSAS